MRETSTIDKLVQHEIANAQHCLLAQFRQHLFEISDQTTLLSQNFEAVRHEYLQSALHRSSAPGSRDQEHDGQGPQGRPGHVQGEEYQRDGSRVEWCIV
jgi:hypothetical protein